MKRIASGIAVLLLAAVLAQGFGGTYTMQGKKGLVTLLLQQDGQHVTGKLSGGGVVFQVEASADQEGVYGVIYSEQGELYFEARLSGDKLKFVMAPFDPDTDKPDPERAVTYLMTRKGAAPAANPLAGAGGGQFAGSYAGDGVALVLRGTGESYSGQVQAGGKAYPLEARVSGSQLQGVFSDAGGQYQFAAVLKGDVLYFQTGGKRYALKRRQATAAAAEEQTGGGQVVARGKFATLTMDNALAFIEAIEFSLQQLGRDVNYSEADKKQYIEALAKNFPQGDRQSQVLISRARLIWNNARANWSQTPLEDKKEFIIDVLVLAFGQDTARQLIAQAQGQGSGGGGGVSAATWGKWGEVSSDISNTTGCWGSNGCSYDSSSGSYDYSADYYSDDY